MSLWEGRFSQAPDPLFRQLNDSLAVDWRLVDDDLRASIVWARALSAAGALTGGEADALCAALHALREEARALERPPLDSGAEDVHTWIEQRLVERLGDVGKKIHTGRSRNDQVSTALRLWLSRELERRGAELGDLQRALLDLAEAHLHTPLPGYTHLQRAQPITLAHWAHAHVEALERDAHRLALAKGSALRCPLGGAALAGSSVAVDRRRIARDLGFLGAMENALDAAGSRDFVLDALYACLATGLTLSRLAEDVVLYTTSEFSYFRLDDAFCSGSSIMPQKKNPDAFELLRARAGALLGLCAGFAATLKALPSGYNKDLQEDKAAVFGAMDQLSLLLRAAARGVRSIRVDEERCAAAARDPALLATELADALARRGVPFRDAHRAVGELVRRAEALSVGLDQLSLDAARAVVPDLAEEDLAALSLASALRRRSALGGTAPEQVALALASARARLERAEALHSDPEDELPVGVRLRGARMAEVGALCELVNYWAQRGRTMRREPDEVAFSLRDFVVAEDDQGALIGCGALRLTNGGLAEICSVAVHPDCTRRGVGRAIVRALQRTAREIGVSTLFLSTDAPGFFVTLGFAPAPRDLIPKQAWEHPVLTEPRKAETVMLWRPDGAPSPQTVQREALQGSLAPAS